MYPADSLQSQIIAPQSSSGLAMRCIGNIGCHAAISSGSTKSGSTDIGVATYPGLTELTRIFFVNPFQFARLFGHVDNACFWMHYMLPGTEEHLQCVRTWMQMLTILPLKLFSIITRAASRHTIYSPVRLMSRHSLHSSTVASKASLW